MTKAILAHVKHFLAFKPSKNMIKHASKKVNQNEKLKKKNRKFQKLGSIFVNPLCGKSIRVSNELD